VTDQESSPRLYWVSPRPQCPEHGPLQYRGWEMTFICAGFDGEGCDYRVSWAGLDWKLTSDDRRGVHFDGR
jgi:hypothetical protein